jgi:hypothetical protein
MPKVAHQVDTSGTGKLIMSLPDNVYDGTIGPIVGITKLTGTPPAGSFSETSVAGVRKGLLGSLKISYRVGTSTKSKTARLLCSLEKLDTCTTELPGKSFKTGTITSARFPVRRRLR